MKKHQNSVWYGLGTPQYGDSVATPWKKRQKFAKNFEILSKWNLLWPGCAPVCGLCADLLEKASKFAKIVKIVSKSGSETEKYNSSMGFYPQGVRRIWFFGLRPHFAISFLRPQSYSKVSPTCPQSVPKLLPKWPQLDSKVTPRLTQSDFKVIPTWPQRDPQPCMSTVRLCH